MDLESDEELTEFIHDQADVEEVESIDDAASTYSKRGPKKIPVQWTRVINIASDGR